MSYFSIFVLAIALSIDAFIVSFSYGIKYNNERIKNSCLISTFTGIFQGLMPILGYFLTNFIKLYIQPYSSLIVFLIFSYLGFKFIVEAGYPERKKELCINVKCLFLIGIATSIDAFSAGISLSLFGVHIFKPAILIALITFINSNIGFFIGGKLKYLNTKKLEILAGILLLSLGIKVLF